MPADEAAALASYESKWVARYPEVGVALAFVAAPSRAVEAALVCWSFEIEHAAFATRDIEPAALKLRWWAEEWRRAHDGDARHPLTRVLADAGASAAIDLGDVYAAIDGALAQRDAPPAADGGALLAHYALLYRPLAALRLAACVAVDAAATARALAAARAVRETAALADALRAGRLPLPLDVLARQRLARGDLARPSALRRAALRDWFTFIVAQIDDVAATRPPLDVVAATMAAADRVRVLTALRSDDPIAALATQLSRVPLAATLAGWRAGRRLVRAASRRADA